MWQPTSCDNTVCFGGLDPVPLVDSSAPTPGEGKGASPPTVEWCLKLFGWKEIPTGAGQRQNRVVLAISRPQRIVLCRKTVAELTETLAAYNVAFRAKTFTDSKLPIGSRPNGTARLRAQAIAACKPHKTGAWLELKSPGPASIPAEVCFALCGLVRPECAENW